MKKILLLLSLFSFLFSFSQKINFKSNLQAIYGIVYKPDSTQNKTNNDIVSLYIGDNQSVFQDEKKYKIDSIIAIQTFTQLSSMPMFRVNHVIFKDLKKQELIFTEIVDKINLGYKEPIGEIKWKLSNEKKNILSYECYKAETNFRGRNYIAWYTK